MLKSAMNIEGTPLTISHAGGGPDRGLLCSTPDPALTSYTTSDFVQATLTFDQPLPANLHLQDVTGFPGFRLTINDGHQTLVSPPLADVLISTDSVGQIIAPWRVIRSCCLFPHNSIHTLNYPDVNGIGDSGTLSGPVPGAGFPDTPWDFGGIIGSPGRWGAPSGGGGGDSSTSYGALANAIVANRFIAFDSFRANVNSLDVFDAYALNYTTTGSALGRGKTFFVSQLPNGNQVTPGLSVGAYANGAGSSGQTAAHGVAFRTYRYTGTVPATIVLHATVHGRLREPSFGLGSGPFGAFAEISVINSGTFKSLLPTSPQQYEDFFFGILGKHTDNVRPHDLFALHPAAKFVSGRFAGIVESLVSNTNASIDFPIDDEYHTKTLSVPIALSPNQSFTVLFDIAAESHTCFEGCGGTSVNFFSSLSSDNVMFTDSAGTPVTLIEPVGGPVTVPGPLVLQGNVTSIKEVIASIPAERFFAPNPKTAENRRKAMLNMLDNVTSLMEAQKYQDAIDQLRDMVKKTDGVLFPPDWIQPDESEVVKKLLSDLIADITSVLPQ
jgi:hypothetical protein